MINLHLFFLRHPGPSAVAVGAWGVGVKFRGGDGALEEEGELIVM